jgi:hypothetical protein
MACSRVRRLGSSLEVATEGMIVAAGVVEATTQDLDRISAVVMDRAVTDAEEVAMASKAAMAMVSRVEMAMASKVEMVTASKVAMAMAMEVDTLEVDMAQDVAVVVEGDTRDGEELRLTLC